MKTDGAMFAAKWVGFQYFRDFLRDSGDALHVFRNTLTINIPPVSEPAGRDVLRGVKEPLS